MDLPITGPMTQFVTDITILGGGIAGLWLLNRLRAQGFDVVLLERDELGAGQTTAAQGILHGGLKYALNGVLSPASSAIAGMPERWRSCLAGQGDVDLRGCRVLSPSFYMWSSGGYRSRLKTFFGSKALHGRIETPPPERYPDFFQGRKLAGALYQLTDFVIDTTSLVEKLAAPHRDRIFRAEAQPIMSDDGEVQALRLGAEADAPTLRAQRYILCAGEGNAALLAAMHRQQPVMQTRPLHMLALVLPHPHPVYLHCIGDSFGMTPRLTITSHPGADGRWVWYVGGELAESGVERSPQEQCEEGKRMLSATFPWIDFSSASWYSFMINRAEPRLPNLQRPDTAYLHASGNLLVSWPTKLTLSPDLGDSVCQELLRQGVAPAANDSLALAAYLQSPAVAAPRWEGHLS